MHTEDVLSMSYDEDNYLNLNDGIFVKEMIVPVIERMYNRIYIDIKKSLLNKSKEQETLDIIDEIYETLQKEKQRYKNSIFAISHIAAIRKKTNLLTVRRFYKDLAVKVEQEIGRVGKMMENFIEK